MKDDLSVVTYTYNDSNLANELIKSITTWSVQPGEIIVVDDGSSPDFKLDRSLLHLPARVIRNVKNLGCAETKNTGISAANNSYILSLDCDIRLSPDWLEVNLPHIQNDKIGIVGCPIITNAGNDIVSRYMYQFHGHPGHGYTDFLTGGVWLLTRKIWQDTGGMDGYTNKTHEDHFFCKKVINNNFKLFSNPDRPAEQVRKISRIALIKRQWAWFKRNEFLKFSKAKSLDICFYLFIDSMLQRISHILKIKDYALIYIELLYMVYVFINLIQHSRKNQIDDPLCSEGSLLSSLKIFMSENERLFTILYKDTKNATCIDNELPDDKAVVKYLALFESMTPLKKINIFSIVQNEAVNEFGRLHKQDYWDFSFYEQ